MKNGSFSQLINEYSVEYEPSKAMKQLKEPKWKELFYCDQCLVTFCHFETAGFEQEKILMFLAIED